MTDEGLETAAQLRELSLYWFAEAAVLANRGARSQAEAAHSIALDYVLRADLLSDSRST